MKESSVTVTPTPLFTVSRAQLPPVTMCDEMRLILGAYFDLRYKRGSSVTMSRGRLDVT